MSNEKEAVMSDKSLLIEGKVKLTASDIKQQGISV